MPAIEVRQVDVTRLDVDAVANAANIVGRATRSTLACAERLGARSLALVAFGTGVGGFPFDEAARIMVGAVREHQGGLLESVIFAVHGDQAERAFRAVVDQR
jgi:O-acetyl-ADP-ribose deacetylase (regulator of RNase III)